jgi:hypothetical protein
MALISVSPCPYAIFVTTPDHDKEGTTLLRISANGLASNVCSSHVCNWLMRRLASGTYFSWRNLETCFMYVIKASSHSFPSCFFTNQIITWKYRVWDSNGFLIKFINACYILHCCGATAQPWTSTLIFEVYINHAQLSDTCTPGRFTLNEWSAGRRSRYLHNAKQTQETNINALCAILNIQQYLLLLYLHNNINNLQ